MNEQSYTMIAVRIIKQQEMVVGSLAWLEAQKVAGLKVSEGNVEVVGDGKQSIETLVKQYEKLFGQASVAVCRDAVKPIVSELDKNMLPEILMA